MFRGRERHRRELERVAIGIMEGHPKLGRIVAGPWRAGGKVLEMLFVARIKGVGSPSTLTETDGRVAVRGV